MMAISQIIFGQHHILDVFGSGLKSTVFCGKNSAKIGGDADCLAQNTQKKFHPIFRIGPKIWDIVEKRLHWASVVRSWV